MLFKKQEPHEEIGLGGLEAYLDSLFEIHTAKPVSQCERTLQKLQKGVSEFRKAASSFNEYSKEPDMEFVGRISIGQATDQKGRYVQSLLSAIDSLESELASASASTSYERIGRKKAAYEALISKMLSINSSFKLVVLGYSAAMGPFKRSFSVLEKGVKELEAELSKGSERFRQYGTLRSHISTLQALTEQVRVLGARLSEFEGAEERSKVMAAQSERVSAAESRRESLVRRISELSSGISSLSGDLHSMLLPIERAARKYDHGRKKARGISDYVTDPLSRLWNEIEYAEFRALLLDMRKSVSSGEIDVKNSEGIVSQIDAISGSGIADLVNEIKFMKSDLNSAKGELLSCDEELHSLRDKKSESATAMEKRESLQEMRAMKIKEIDGAKLTISRLFSEYYKKDIGVMVPKLD